MVEKELRSTYAMLEVYLYTGPVPPRGTPFGALAEEMEASHDIPIEGTSRHFRPGQAHHTSRTTNNSPSESSGAQEDFPRAVCRRESDCEHSEYEDAYAICHE